METGNRTDRTDRTRARIAGGGWWLGGVLGLVLVFSSAPIALAAPAAGDVETFRGELLEMVSLLGEIAELTPGLADGGRVARLEKRVQSLDSEALRRFSQAVQVAGGWQSSLDWLRLAADELRSVEAPGEAGATQSEGFPDYSALCGVLAPSATILHGALNLAELFESFNIIAQSECDSAPSGDVAPTNALICVLTTVTGELSLAAQSVYDNFSLCSVDVSSVETAAIYDLADGINQQVEQNLDEQVSTRASQASVDDLAAEVQTVEAGLGMLQGSVANLQAEIDDVQVRVTDTQLGVDDLETRVSDVEQSVDDLRIEVQDLADTTAVLSRTLDDFVDSTQSFEALNLQILIEADLEQQDEPAVSLFQLPASVGGFLELAREIVVSTIEANRSAGLDVGSASEYAAEGDLRFNAGAYRDAYQLYREAYHRATGGLER